MMTLEIPRFNGYKEYVTLLYLAMKSVPLLDVTELRS